MTCLECTAACVGVGLLLRWSAPVAPAPSNDVFTPFEIELLKTMRLQKRLVDQGFTKEQAIALMREARRIGGRR